MKKCSAHCSLNCCVSRTYSVESESPPNSNEISPKYVKAETPQAAATCTESLERNPTGEEAEQEAGNGAVRQAEQNDESGKGGKAETPQAAAACTELPERNPTGEEGEQEAGNGAARRAEQDDESGAAISETQEVDRHFYLTEQEKLEYQEAFKMFDDDNDSVITATDLFKIMQNFKYTTSNDELDAVLRSISNEEKERVTFYEFQRVMTVEKYVPADVRSAFILFDTDKNGILDRNEVQRALRFLKEGSSDKCVDYIMKYADRDGDGNIDYEEFVYAVLSKDL